MIRVTAHSLMLKGLVLLSLICCVAFQAQARDLVWQGESKVDLTGYWEFALAGSGEPLAESDWQSDLSD